MEICTNILIQTILVVIFGDFKFSMLITRFGKSFYETCDYLKQSNGVLRKSSNQLGFFHHSHRMLQLMNFVPFHEKIHIFTILNFNMAFVIG